MPPNHSLKLTENTVCFPPHDISSPNDNTSPHARAFYDNHVARRRQLSSGPLGGDCQQSLVVFVVPNPYVRCTVFRGPKGESSTYLLQNTPCSPLLQFIYLPKDVQRNNRQCLISKGH